MAPRPSREEQPGRVGDCHDRPRKCSSPRQGIERRHRPELVELGGESACDAVSGMREEAVFPTGIWLNDYGYSWPIVSNMRVIICLTYNRPKKRVMCVRARACVCS